MSETMIQIRPRNLPQIGWSDYASATTPEDVERLTRLLEADGNDVRTVPVCEFQYDAAGPHDGCGEFAPSERHECSAEATVVLEIEEHVYGEEKERVAMCRFHADFVLREAEESICVSARELSVRELLLTVSGGSDDDALPEGTEVVVRLRHADDTYTGGVPRHRLTVVPSGGSDDDFDPRGVAYAYGEAYVPAGALPPKGWHEQADGTLVCPHRDLSVCPSCADAHEACVEVVGAHFWLPDADDRALVAAGVAGGSDDDLPPYEARVAVQRVRSAIEQALATVAVAEQDGDGEQPFHDPGFALSAALAQLEDVPLGGLPYGPGHVGYENDVEDAMRVMHDAETELRRAADRLRDFRGQVEAERQAGTDLRGMAESYTNALLRNTADVARFASIESGLSAVRHLGRGGR